MEITTTSSRPFERCALDIVGPTAVTNKGNRYILTFQDDLSKFMAAIPIPTQDAETVAREFVQNIVLKYGIPEVILNDQLANSLSELFASVCNLLQIKKIRTTAFTQSRTVASNGDINFLSNIFDIIWQKTSETGTNG
jgi:hypothetical protein